MAQESAENMPQLVKGGKYVFGWSIISGDGRILIPDEARLEYQLNSGERVIIISGSKTSGGFSISRKPVIEQSRLSNILVRNPDLAEFRFEEGKTINIGGKSMCWTTILDNGQLLLTPHILEAYGVKLGAHLLVGRGSYVGLGMVVKGPIVEEARNHPEIAIFIPGAV